MLNGILDFSSKTAYYLQLKDLLQKKIETHELAIGDQLPSEAELCTQYSVSRTVVRQALMELEHEGLIYKRKGKGTFVAKPKLSLSLTKLKSGFSDDVSKKGLSVSTQVLNKELIPATEKIARNLKSVNVGEEVLWLQRLRFVNGEPMALENTWLPARLVACLIEEDLSQSLYSILKEKYNITFTNGERLIEAVSANEEESRLFNMPKGGPILLIRLRTFVADGTQVEWGVVARRGDRSRIEAQVALNTDCEITA